MSDDVVVENDLKSETHWIRRRNGFRLVAIVLGCLPVLLLEMGLRLWQPVTLAIVDGVRTSTPLFQLNQTSSRWEIPVERSNYFCMTGFPADKSPKVKRIFVLGGSTVQGRPYATETAFSTFLQLRLQAASQTSEFEVVNCGGISYASHRIEPILHEILGDGSAASGYQADAIVLYTGHNEFLEDRESFRLNEQSVAPVWLKQVSRHVRVISWLGELVGRVSGPSPLPVTDAKSPAEFTAEVEARLDKIGGLESYQRDPVWRRQIELDFESALRRMVGLCQSRDVPLIACVPASDVVRTPPFKVQADPLLSEQERALVETLWADVADSNRETRERFEACKDILEIDPEHAGGHYWVGRHSLTQSSALDEIPSTTQRHLIMARDFDVCPLRATSNIETSVRVIGQELECLLVDTPQLLDCPPRSPLRKNDGIADPAWFVDHVHPSVAGHQEIAKQLAGKFESLGWIQWKDRNERLYDQAVHTQLASLGEDYFIRGKQRLRGLKLWAAGRAGLPTDDSESQSTELSNEPNLGPKHPAPSESPADPR